MTDLLPHGLPGPLPKGERLLWQGRPALLSLARRAFHVDLVALYFGGLAAFQAYASGRVSAAWPILLAGALGWRSCSRWPGAPAAPRSTP